MKNKQTEAWHYDIMRQGTPVMPLSVFSVGHLLLGINLPLE